MSFSAIRRLQGMSKVRIHISVSADGYVAGPDQSLENPLGEGGEGLHEWIVALKAWRTRHGLRRRRECRKRKSPTKTAGMPRRSCA